MGFCCALNRMCRYNVVCAIHRIYMYPQGELYTAWLGDALRYNIGPAYLGLGRNNWLQHLADYAIVCLHELQGEGRGRERKGGGEKGGEGREGRGGEGRGGEGGQS